VNKNIRQVSGTHYIVSALTPIEEFNAFFKAEIEDIEFDTIGGVVTNKFGHLPKRNEYISIDSFTFHVMQADSRRVRLLRMTIAGEEKNKHTQ
ncbi:magnesium/cobalt efflux protein, partial [Pseudomonadales bacterium]|nr:magnesium/cobalt efflux protein [Pseudomonadales bacterium]